MEEYTARERRRSKRRNLSYYLPVIDENTQQIFGHLVDVSMKGFMLDSKNNVPIQRDFNLRLDLTESIANKSLVRFVARSKWCRTDPIQPFVFNVGLEFTSISQGDAEIIRIISERYGARESASFSI
jgi:hypothetical protein